jgi:chromosome segregation ATPase
MRDFNIRVAKLELAEARAESNRFTSGDWASAKARIDEDRQNLDRRITRQEEAMLAIKETLDRIEEKIDVFNEK